MTSERTIRDMKDTREGDQKSQKSIGRYRYRIERKKAKGEAELLRACVCVCACVCVRARVCVHAEACLQGALGGPFIPHPYASVLTWTCWPASVSDTSRKEIGFALPLTL